MIQKVRKPLLGNVVKINNANRDFKGFFVRISKKKMVKIMGFYDFLENHKFTKTLATLTMLVLRIHISNDNVFFLNEKKTMRTDDLVKNKSFFSQVRTVKNNHFHGKENHFVFLIIIKTHRAQVFCCNNVISQSSILYKLS